MPGCGSVFLGVFSQGGATGGSRYHSIIASLSCLNSTSAGHRCAMLLLRLRSADEQKRQFPPHPDRSAEMQSLAASGA